MEAPVGGATGSGVAHWRQNFEPSEFSVPHVGQEIGITLLGADADMRILWEELRRRLHCW